MKKNNFLLLFLSLICFFSCSQAPERPKITLEEYQAQAMTAQGMVEKILGESDYKRMHNIAKAVEDSRAINCVAISDECNMLAKVLNKIVSSTQNSTPGEADNVEIYKMIHELKEEFKKGSEALAQDWATYNKSVAPLSKK